jgi:hypothetical protein
MRPFSMSYISGEDRGQTALLPAAIEDYVVADALVRVIDAFVDGLDVIVLGFGRSVRALTSAVRSARPAEALSLWLFERGALVAPAGARVCP